MRRLLEPLLKVWRDRVWGPRLRTYGEAREELGGVPWRKFTDTERWFLPSHRNLPPPVPAAALATHSGAISLDTSALKLLKPGLPALLHKKSTWIVAGVSLIVGIVLFSSGGSAKPAPAPVAAVAAPVAAPVAEAPKTVEPVAVKPASAPVAQVERPHSARMSPSVKALLSGKSGRVAHPAHHKGRRR